MTFPRKVFLIIYYLVVGFVGWFIVYKQELYVPVKDFIDRMMDDAASFGYTIVGIAALGVVFSAKDFIWSGVLYLVDMSLGISQFSSAKRAVMRKAISLEKRGRHADAGALYEEVEELKRAADCYYKAQQWENAARVFEFIGEYKRAAKIFEKADAPEKAVKIYQDINDEVGATQLHLRCAERDLHEGRMRSAADHFLEAKQLMRAAEVLEKMGNLDEAGGIYFKGGFFDQAAECFKRQIEEWDTAIKSGNPPPGGISKLKQITVKAAESFEKGDSYQEAAELYEKSESWDKAGELYAEAGMHDKAAKCYLKTGNTRDARESLRLSGNVDQLKEFTAMDALEEGKYDYAAKQFLELGNYEKAIEAYRRAKNNVGMGEVYAQMGRYVSAAEQFSLGGDQGRAAEMYEEGNDMRQAAELYSHVGNLPKAIMCMEKEGLYFEAGQLNERAGNIRQAIACMQRVSYDSDNYREACACLGRLFTAENQFDEAARFFSVAMEGGKLPENFIRDYYDYAVKLEDNQRFFEAANAFKQVAGMDYSYRDANERYQKLQQMNPQQFQNPPSSGQMPIIPAGTHAGITRVTGSQPGLTGGQNAYAQPQAQPMSAPPHQVPASASNKIATGEFPAMGDDTMNSMGTAADEYPTSGVTGPPPARTATSPGLGDSTHQVQHSGNTTSSGGYFAPQDDRYELLEELGRGGMGVVYKAKDTMLDRVVALKMLPSAISSESDEDYQNFLREARTIAKLTHPNIVTIYDIGRRADRYYFSMEHVSGSNLRRLVAELGAPSIRVVTRICQDICTALQYARDRAIIHRDVKPGNILISENDEIKIVDFGLAKIISDHPGNADGPASISAGFMMGTPHYMSPEQIRGEKLDHRTDIYAFGLTLYFMLTGRSVFDSFNCKSPMEIVDHQLNTDLPSPLSVRPELPREFELIYYSCVEKDREKRLTSMTEAMEQLDAVPLP
jgi:tetratricopeptide (TPR) repeat protein/predicted Ser/Thr protein kinase